MNATQPPPGGDQKHLMDIERLKLDRARMHLEQLKLDLEREKLALEREKMTRARWWHEDSLVNNRLTWLLVSQALLFAALGALTRAADGAPAGRVPLHLVLAGLIPTVGGLVAAGVLLATIAACWAQWKIARQTGSGLGVSRVTTLLGWAPSLVLPMVFLWAWYALGVATRVA
jgi:hypothetical protein